MVADKPPLNISQRRILVSDDSGISDKKPSGPAPKDESAAKTTLLAPNGTSKLSSPAKPLADAAKVPVKTTPPKKPAPAATSLPSSEANRPKPGLASPTISTNGDKNPPPPDQAAKTETAPDADVEVLRSKYQIPSHKLTQRKSPLKTFFIVLLLLIIVTAVGAYFWINPDSPQDFIDEIRTLT